VGKQTDANLLTQRCGGVHYFISFETKSKFRLSHDGPDLFWQMVNGVLQTINFRQIQKYNSDTAVNCLITSFFYVFLFLLGKGLLSKINVTYCSANLGVGAV
jgi:hypothetical protein